MTSKPKHFDFLLLLLVPFSKLFLCVCILHSFAAALCTISSPLSCQDPNPAVKSPEASVGCKSGDCVLVLQELQNTTDVRGGWISPHAQTAAAWALSLGEN